jgi:hypothetical protein
MKRKNKYKQKSTWSSMTQGEVRHHIGKKMTQQTHTSKKLYSRKEKHKSFYV